MSWKERNLKMVQPSTFERWQVETLLNDFANLVPVLKTIPGAGRLLGGFRAQPPEVQADIVRVFLQLMKDWCASDPVVSEENKQAVGFARLVSDIGPNF